jgi:hypothetical protein
VPLADLLLLTPFAALFALAALVPLAAFAHLLRRDARVRNVLRMPPPRRAHHAPLVLALVAVPALIAAAATQPVLEFGEKRYERTDAQAYVVFDTSRSMLAAAQLNGRNRLDRAKTLAVAVRDRIPEIPVGIASLTDRALPHLFPTADRDAFASTVRRSIAIESPPPAEFYALHATRIGRIENLATRNYFAPQAKRRLVIVLTDGESRPPAPRLQRLFALHGVRGLYVHLWDEDERVYGVADAPEPAYVPDPRSREILDVAASLTRGRAFGNDARADEIAAAVTEMLGAEGAVKPRPRDRIALAPWVTLAAFLPLGFALRRRNL